MEQNSSISRGSLADKSTIDKTCEILGIRLNPFQNIEGNSNARQVNTTSDIFDIRNLYFLRKKRILFCLGNDDFNTKLSNELVLLIFKLLPIQDLVHCRMVCKRWYQITQTEILWSRLDLYRKTLHEDTLCHILSRGVKVLRLMQAKIVTFMSQERKGNINENNIYKLEYLDATMAMISPDNLGTLLSKCTDLKKLSLESCSLNEKCYKAISHCTNLLVLNLTMCEGINFRCIMNLLNLTSLTELNVAWCSLDMACVSLICKLLPRSIIRLNISGCRETLMDDNIIDLVQSCPYLIDLDLSDCCALTDNSLYTILNLSKLQHLALNRCFGINPSSYTILRTMPCLIYLDIFGLSQEPALEGIQMNNFMFSSIARPTTGNNRNTIWGLRVK